MIKSTLTQLALIIISIALYLCQPLLWQRRPSIAHQPPTKDDILYLKQDAPVFENHHS